MTREPSKNSVIPSFEIQTGDLDNPPYRALLEYISIQHSPQLRYISIQHSPQLQYISIQHGPEGQYICIIQQSPQPQYITSQRIQRSTQPQSVSIQHIPQPQPSAYSIACNQSVSIQQSPQTQYLSSQYEFGCHCVCLFVYATALPTVLGKYMSLRARRTLLREVPLGVCLVESRIRKRQLTRADIQSAILENIRRWSRAQCYFEEEDWGYWTGQTKLNHSQGAHTR